MPQSGTRSVLPTLVRNGSDRSGVVQCSPYRKASLSGNRTAARFGAYHRAGYGGYYTTKRRAERRPP